ncbi:MAG: DUF2314 domain-containing protein [Planctomycetota bacterium]|jgi:uncharacterized protein YegJ (DUF2314 family)
MMRRRSPFFVTIFTSVMVAVSALVGCEETTAPVDGPGRQSAAPEEAPSPWLPDGAGGYTVIAGDDIAAVIADAVAEAHATMDRAREAWQATDARGRADWAIKWQARATQGRTEYVWVEPLNWSPFRVEGRLLSRPNWPLECDAVPGDIVSFPIEELSDWVRRLPGGTREGGFTISALEAEYGPPT